MLVLVMVNLIWMDFVCIVLIENICGGGLMIRNDFCFYVVICFNMVLFSFCIEFMMLKVKINRLWFVFIGIYKFFNIFKN